MHNIAIHPYCSEEVCVRCYLSFINFTDDIDESCVCVFLCVCMTFRNIKRNIHTDDTLKEKNKWKFQTFSCLFIIETLPAPSTDIYFVKFQQWMTRQYDETNTTKLAWLGFGYFILYTKNPAFARKKINIKSHKEFKIDYVFLSWER